MRLAAALLLALGACQRAPDPAPVQARADIAASEADAAGWPSYGGQASATKYSALDQINLKTVGRLHKA